MVVPLCFAALRRRAKEREGARTWEEEGKEEEEEAEEGEEVEG